jgi:hypothetical protein
VMLVFTLLVLLSHEVCKSIIMFTKNSLEVMIVDVRNRWWFDTNDFFIIFFFEYKRLLLVHLNGLKRILL